MCTVQDGAVEVGVKGQLSEEVRVMSGVPVLRPLLFLAYVNDIWRNVGLTIRLSVDDRIIYRKILNNNDLESLQIDLNRIEVWAFEKEMIINPTKSKDICFTKARMMDPLNYSL
jgi:hypothetical protein